jgi:hypothetical protein
MVNASKALHLRAVGGKSWNLVRTGTVIHASAYSSMGCSADSGYTTMGTKLSVHQYGFFTLCLLLAAIPHFTK